MDALNSISQLLGLIAFAALIWLAVRAFRKRRIWWGLGILFIPLIPMAAYMVYFTVYGPSRYHLYLPWAMGLLVPIAATVYAIKYWPEVKTPFLVYIASFTTGAALGLYVFTSTGGWKAMDASQDVAEGIAKRTLTQEDSLKFMRSNMDVVEKSGPSEKEQKEMELMRGMLDKMETEFTEEDQKKFHQEIMNLANPSASGKTVPDVPRPASEDQSKNGAKTEADGKSESASLSPGSRQKPLPVSLIRFSGSGSGRQGFSSKALAQARSLVGEPVIVTRRNGAEQRAILMEISGSTLRFEQRWRDGSFSFAYGGHEIESIRRIGDIP